MASALKKTKYIHYLSALVVSAVLPTLTWADRLEDILKNQVYPQGGVTLYCQTQFSPSARIKADQVYSEKDILHHFGCITSRQCSSKPEFKAAAEDLHNLFPVERKSSYDKRGTRFGDIPDNVPYADEQCRYQVSFQTFEPPDESKGDVARAMMYMHEQYGLPIIGDLGLFKEWNKQDPVDEEEQRRNRVIRNIQGNSNSFIDTPSKAERLGGFRAR